MLRRRVAHHEPHFVPSVALSSSPCRTTPIWLMPVEKYVSETEQGGPSAAPSFDDTLLTSKTRPFSRNLGDKRLPVFCKWIRDNPNRLRHLELIFHHGPFRVYAWRQDDTGGR